MRINIPNQITPLRLALSIVFFAALSQHSLDVPQSSDWVLPICFWLFLTAALSDFADGWLARAWGQETPFGRVVDPVVDKVLVCGAFAFFAGSGFYDPVTHRNVTGVSAWMVVLILLRELLVSAIRAFAEGQGTDFSANWVGKLKMFVQSASACVILGVLSWFRSDLDWLMHLCVWSTVVVTALSIFVYLRRAAHLLFSPAAMGGASPVDREPRSAAADLPSASARARPGARP